MNEVRPSLDVFVEILEDLAEYERQTVSASGNARALKAFEAFSKVRQDFDTIEFSRNTVRSALLNIRSNTKIDDKNRIRYRELLEQVEISLSISALIEDFPVYYKNRFNKDKIARIGDISAQISIENSKIDFFTQIENINQAVLALEKAFSFLDVPQEIAQYIAGEIGEIREIITYIDEYGSQSIWEKIYFAGQTINSYEFTVNEENKSSFNEQSSIWSKSILAITGASQAYLVASGLVLNTHAIYEMLPESFQTKIHDAIEQVGPRLITDQSTSENDNG